MTCNPRNVSEIPGSYVSCQILVVRECLSVNGQEVIPGAATVHTDGVTMTGDGSLATPVALRAVQHDGTMTGLGTVASPLSVPAGPPATVITDDVTVQGNGSGGSPVAIKRVQADDTIAGAGTVASPLTAQKLAGLAGIVDTTQAPGGVPTLTVTSVDPGAVAIQAQNGTLGLAGSGISMQAFGQAIALGAAPDLPSLHVAEFVAGSAQSIGTALTARIRYNEGTNKLEVSLNGAAYVAIVTL